ncbi:hypothetical protein D3C81_880560 [compost metagenome]
MTAGLGADRGEGAHLGAVLLHVLTTRAAELAQRHRHANRVSGQLVRHRQMLAHDGRAIIEHRTQGAGLHLLEAQGQGAFHGTALHCLASQEQRGGAGGAVVVDVDHRHTAHADFVECRLAAGGITVHVTDIGLLDQVVVQAGVLQRQTGGFSAHLDVRATGARLEKRDHANPGNIRFLRHHNLHIKLSLLRLSGFWFRRLEQTAPAYLRSGYGLYPLGTGGSWVGGGGKQRPALGP